LGFGLNLFTISHTARTISCTAMGRLSTTCVLDSTAMDWNRTSRPATVSARPQTDSQRGISWDP